MKFWKNLKFWKILKFWKTIFLQNKCYPLNLVVYRAISSSLQCGMLLNCLEIRRNQSVIILINYLKDFSTVFYFSANLIYCSSTYHETHKGKTGNVYSLVLTTLIAESERKCGKAENNTKYNFYLTKTLWVLTLHINNTISVFLPCADLITFHCWPVA